MDVPLAAVCLCRRYEVPLLVLGLAAAAIGSPAVALLRSRTARGGRGEGARRGGRGEGRRA